MGKWMYDPGILDLQITSLLLYELPAQTKQENNSHYVALDCEMLGE
jgi:hypothetical protein